MAKLTPKQQKFCNEYLSNGNNATQAAIAAGYSKKTARIIGSKLLTSVNILKFLSSKKEVDVNQSGYDQKKHFLELEELHKMAVKAGDVKAALKAVELKGKLNGLYIEKHQEVEKITFTCKWGDNEQGT